MNACKALLVVLSLSLAAVAEGPLALPLPPVSAPLPAAPAPAPRWLHKAAHGSLVVRSATSGAQVAVDGRAVGVVPLAPVSLAPGRHEVRLSKNGFLTATRHVRVLAGQKAVLAVDLKVELKALPLPLPQAPLAAGQPAAAEPVSSPSDALTALIAAPPGAAGSGAGSVGAPAGAAAAPGVASVAAQPLPGPPLVLATAVAPVPPAKAPPAAVAPQPAASEPLTKKWWFWGGAAVGAAVLTAAVTWALPALYVERRDPAAACSGTCGIVVNK